MRFTIDASVHLNALNPAEEGSAASQRFLAAVHQPPSGAASSPNTVFSPTLLMVEIAASVARDFDDAERSASATRRRRWRPLPAVAVFVLAVLAAPAAEAACLRAVFFDLGNTLAERGEGGLFVVRPGARETIEKLRAAGVEIGVITNVPAGWTRDDLEALLAEPEFLDQFDVLLMSSQAPARKPDPRIYLLAHSLLATPVPIGETAFVGETLAEIADSEDDPTSGARAVGMVGIHLSDAPPSPLADHTIPTGGLTEIVTLRANLCASVSDDVEPGDTGR